MLGDYEAWDKDIDRSLGTRKRSSSLLTSSKAHEKSQFIFHYLVLELCKVGLIPPAWMHGTVGKIFAFQPQGFGFNPTSAEI